MIYSLSPIFSRKHEIETFQYIMFVWKIFLANIFVLQNNYQISTNYMLTGRNFQYSDLCNCKLCITHKSNTRTIKNWEIRLFCVGLYLLNWSILGLQNGPLMNLEIIRWYIFRVNMAKWINMSRPQNYIISKYKNTNINQHKKKKTHTKET